MSAASKAWSIESTTITLANRTIQPVSKSSYQPPSVSSCSDESDAGHGPKFPVDFPVVLDVTTNDTSDLSSATGKSALIQENTNQDHAPEGSDTSIPQLNNSDNATISHIVPNSPNDFQPGGKPDIYSTEEVWVYRSEDFSSPSGDESDSASETQLSGISENVHKADLDSAARYNGSDREHYLGHSKDVPHHVGIDSEGIIEGFKGMEAGEDNTM